MSIRFATLEDIPALVALGRRMHAITRFQHFDYDETRVAQSLTVAITNSQQRYVCLVATNSQGQCVGVLLATVEQHIFSPQLTASIMHYDVLPESRMAGWGVRLLRAFELWAKNRAIVEVVFGINSGDETGAVGRFAAKMGFTRVGEILVKTL